MADRRVLWSDAARADLRAIVFHIAHDSIDSALAVAERLEQRAGALGALTARGRVVPELRRVGERRFRELIEGPWRIVYLADGSLVHVVAVVDSRRNLQDWLCGEMLRFRSSRE